jgi:LPXTG-motif cell wall-anchored protein
MKQAGLDDSFAGRWMEIFGRLESQHKVHKLREIHVKSFMPVPVVLPRVSEATPAPFVPSPEVAAPVETVIIPEQAVATAGVRTVLPKTATSLPLFALIGFVSLAAGFGVRLFNRRLEQG